MTDIKKLLNKYYKPDGENMTGAIKVHPAERHSNQYHNIIRSDQKKKHRYLILQQLSKEVPFYLHDDQIQQIKYWINIFNDNFKEFHRQASEETIILALIFIQRKQTHKDTQIYRYKISSKYNLTMPVFTTIQNQLIFQLMKTTPLTYNQKITLNNEILQKGQGE